MLIHDHRTRDLNATVLSLRKGLVFAPRKIGGQSCYLLEDPVNSKYYSIGLAEYFFLSCLDGATSVGEALSLVARTHPSDALTESEAAVVCRWLLESDLASTSESNMTAGSRMDTTSNSRWWHGLHPLHVKLPLCFPDSFFDKLTPWGLWLYSARAVLFGSFLVLMGMFQILTRWDSFIAAAPGVLSPNRWVWLVLCWFGLKVLHEISHGIVCKKYQGNVHEAGVIFVLLAPLAYVDVTSSWRFRSKWQRIFTAAAGMYVEVLVASVASFVWANTEPGIVNDLCFNVVLMATVTTLVFNANPLMRFDGYYILTDLLGIPNLYSDAQLLIRKLARRWVLGDSNKELVSSQSRNLFIHVYGVASFCWRQLITFSLILIASTMFDGAGIIVASVAAIMWIVVPVVQVGWKTITVHTWDRTVRIRMALIVIPIGLFLSYAATTLPWIDVIQAPAIVDYSPLSVLRAGSPGFVRRIHVESGVTVQQGSLIATLENKELEAELRELELIIEQSKLRARRLEQREELAACQTERTHLESFLTKLHEKQREVAQLSIVAPRAGRVLIRNGASLIGTYATAGTEIAAIGEENQKELRIAIRQEDVEAFREQLDQRVNVRLPGVGRLSCELIRLNPLASLVPEYASLCAKFGGPLEVRESVQTDENTAGNQYELLKPRFTGIVRLGEIESVRLRVGQRGVAWLRCDDETLIRYVIRRIGRQISDARALNGTE